MEKILIFGGTGNIGSVLCDYALNKNCEVHVVIRRSSNYNTQRLDYLYSNPEIGRKTLHLHYGDVCDEASIFKIINLVQPTKIFNLAAQSHVAISNDIPVNTCDITGLGVIRILEAIRIINPKIKFLQMSSSEMYGNINGNVQLNENSKFKPASPYACAKMFGYYATINYRESFDMHCSNSITFNTEGKNRGKNFAPRKITCAIADILAGRQDYIPLGAIDSCRDWSLDFDIVDGLWKILEHEKADDFCLSSNETHSIREFVEVAFKCVGIDITWQGKGLDEIGVDSKTGKTLVKIDERFFRPLDVTHLWGDSSKARTVLNWQPKTTFKDLVKLMVEHDLKEAGIQL